MGGTVGVDNIPLNIVFSHGFLYLELEKAVYYPGETIKGCVHLLVNKQLDSVNTLDILLKGKETFNYRSTQKREENSTRNSYTIFENQQTLCNFFRGSIAVGQYSFKFQIDLPQGSNGQLIPASFMQRQVVTGKGIFKARIRYSVDVLLIGTEEHSPLIFKQSRRFFMAQIPTNAKNVFYETHQANVVGPICGAPKGSNLIETKFERNYYLTDEVIKTMTRVDNSQCRTVCSKVICKLIKTLVCMGGNGHQFKLVETLARFEAEGVAANQSTIGFQKDVDIIINDNSLNFDVLRVKKMKHFKQEDLNFAKYTQPSTKGNCIDCFYTLVVTREFNKGWCEVVDTPGISINVTLNPGLKQIDGFKKLPPPEFWNPNFIDCEPVFIKVLAPLNRIINPYDRINRRREQQQAQNQINDANNDENIVREERRPLLSRSLFG